MLNFDLDANIDSLPYLLYMEEQEKQRNEAAAMEEISLRQQDDFASEKDFVEDDTNPN